MKGARAVPLGVAVPKGAPGAGMGGAARDHLHGGQRVLGVSRSNRAPRPRVSGSRVLPLAPAPRWAFAHIFMSPGSALPYLLNNVTVIAGGRAVAREARPEQ